MGRTQDITHALQRNGHFYQVIAYPTLPEECAPTPEAVYLQKSTTPSPLPPSLAPDPTRKFVVNANTLPSSLSFFPFFHLYSFTQDSAGEENELPLRDCCVVINSGLDHFVQYNPGSSLNLAFH